MKTFSRVASSTEIKFSSEQVQQKRSIHTPPATIKDFSRHLTPDNESDVRDQTGPVPKLRLDQIHLKQEVSSFHLANPGTLVVTQRPVALHINVALLPFLAGHFG
ncbi:hypothetical protein RRG08_047287 [Elysia crispata]|uniref:Uncharacterized protein n=1 Tax=Elysia crispata TaxID=231223 RepID=A0AAE0ZCA3_9GAST|nr:hypothetical protein RRG08_047287 [Elysia crispata]